MKHMYYIPIEIWSRKDSKTVECYSIFQRISDGKYAVQSKDIYREDSIDKLASYFEKQRIFLFMEENIDERGLFKDTIEESIVVFDNSFDD